MLNLEELFQKIENTRPIEKTTKELKEFGLNDYYIKKSVEMNLLEKISRGKYKVINSERDKMSKHAFKDFKKKVFRGEFLEAYDSLLINYQNRITNDYDYHLKIYFILLKEILKDKKDFSFIDKIPVFYKRNEEVSYFSHFNNFHLAVLAGDFETAYKEINKFRIEENNAKGSNCLSTKLFTTLMIYIDKSKAYNSAEILNILESYLSNNDLEQALEEIRRALKYIDSKEKARLINLEGVLKTCLDLKVNKKTLVEKNINYASCEDNCVRIFNAAINYADYLTAYENIGKCLSLHPKSKRLKVFNQALHILMTENNKNKDASQNVSEKTFTKESLSINLENIERLITSKELTKNNIEQAIQEIRNARLTAPYKKRTSLLNLESILKSYLNLKANKKTLEEKKINYISCGADYLKIFNSALGYEDYLTAYKNIGKCLYLYPNSKFLNLFDRTLQILIEEHKKNRKLLEEKEKSPINEVQNMDSKTIKRLVDNREYEKLAELLEVVDSTDRVIYYTKKLVREINNQSNNQKSSMHHHTKNYIFTDSFNYLFDALNFNDFEAASLVIDECLEKALLNNKDIEELSIYKALIEEILNLDSIRQEKLNQARNIRSLELLRENLLKEYNLSNSNIIESINITTQLLSLSEDEKNRYILEMLESLLTIRESKITESDYQKFTYQENNILRNFMNTIKYGDYPSAYQLLSDERLEEEFIKQDALYEFLTYKKLLSEINNSLNINKPQAVTPKKQADYEIPILKDTKRLLKKNQFIKAQEVYQTGDKAPLNETLKLELDVYLSFLSNAQIAEEKELELSYKLALNRGDYQQAKQILDTIKEYLTKCAIDKEIDYYESRLLIEEKDAYTTDFVKKEQLYSRAIYLFENEEYDQVLATLSTYNSLDNNLNSKGYYLLGRTYEKQNNLKEAKSSYEKSLIIEKNPNTLFSLGRICLLENNLDEANNYFSECLNRDNDYSKSISDIMDKYNSKDKKLIKQS